jgi:Na+-transporting methylmalonyl-CoA/oxaloacetate decarboxylase gamma subunit
MDNKIFGLTMLIVGMGGTLLTLWLLALLIKGITQIFPVENDKKKKD